MKRMSRFLSLALSLLLSLSLTLPALAASGDASYDAFVADFDSFWAGYWASEYYTVDEYVEEFGYADQEDLMRSLYEVWLENEAYDAWRESFLAEHADEVAAFDAEAYWRDSYYYSYGYDTVDAFLTDSEMTREEFDQWMLEDWLSDQWYLYQEELARAETIRALGGTPGELGVMLNGAYLTFPDAKPEAAEGRIMVPLRVLMEALGAQVSYSGGTVTCTLEDRSLSFAVGGDTVSVTADGAAETITLDAPSYAKGGRTYVPVRFFAQALGCVVLWDSDYQTAVLVDPAAAVETVDSQFTIVNRALAALSAAPPAGQSTRSTASAELEMTMLDSLNGDTPYTGSLDLDALTNETAASGTLTIQLGDALLDLLTEDSGLSVTELALVRTALKQIRLDYIADLEHGRCWFQLPLLEALTSGVYDGETWYGMPLETAELTSDPAGALTMGQLLYSASVLNYDEGYSYGAVFCWSDLMDSADSAAQLLGDDQFTRSGSRDVLTYTLDDYAADYGAYSAEELQEFSFRLAVDEAGACDVSLTIHTDSSYSYASNYRLVLTGSAGTGVLNADLDLHMANQYKLELRLDLAQTASEQLPQSAPPAGADVVDLDAAVDEEAG